MKKSMYASMLLILSAFLMTGCANDVDFNIDLSNLENNEVLDADVRKECSMVATFHVLEKSNVLSQEGEKSYVIASEFQSEPVLLSVGRDHYQRIETGKSYEITFEGDLDASNTNINLISRAFAQTNLDITQVKEVEPHGLENEQQPLTCK